MDIVTKPLRAHTILSLDIATNTGYAIYQNGRIISYGLWKFRSGNYRYTALKNNIKSLQKEYQFTEIVAENYFKGKYHNADRVLSKFHETIDTLAKSLRIPVTYINPQQAKESTTGNRYANKDEIIEVIQSYGYRLEGNKIDDIADALSILFTYLKSLGLPVPVYRTVHNGPEKSTYLLSHN